MRLYRAQPYPAEHEWAAKLAGPKRCGANASLLARAAGLVLVGGYGLSWASTPGHRIFREPVWVGHYWCADADGGVVDPTWGNGGLLYVGAPVDLTRTDVSGERILMAATGRAARDLDRIVRETLG